MSTPQSFLLFLIVLGGAATMLRLVSRTTPTVPYAVLVAIGGILIGLIPGVRLHILGPDLILLAFVPGVVFEASLALDLPEAGLQAVPISLLAPCVVILAVMLIDDRRPFSCGRRHRGCAIWRPDRTSRGHPAHRIL